MARVIKACAVVNALTVLVLGAARFNLPDGFWKDKTPVIVVVLIHAFVASLVQIFVGERGEKARRVAIEREQKISDFLIACLDQLTRNAGADWRTTGIQVFEVRGKWNTRHRRIVRVRLSHAPPSGVKWTKGKGVIGMCWESGQAQYHNVGARLAAYADFDKDRFEALTPSLRFGLTYDDFKRLGDKYGIVACAPIIGDDEVYLGCVSADAPTGTSGTLRQAEVIHQLTMTARLVRAVL
jgi:hypothetical protein